MWDWLQDKEWSVEPFIPIALTFVFLLVALYIARRLQQSIRDHFHELGLDDAKKDDIRNVVADYSLKLSLYTGLLPLVAILSSTVLLMETVERGAVAAVLAIVLLIGVVLIPLVFLAKPGQLSEEFVSGGLPWPERLLHAARLRSYATAIGWVYILAVVVIQVAIVIIGLPTDALDSD